MKILFAVSGSIAAYKAYDTVRELVKAKHQVKVILTKGALQFIKAETFHYLGASEVFSPNDDFSPNLTDETITSDGESNIRHINLRNWCDKIIIYPLSANTCAHLAAGMANDLLQSVLLANTKPVMIFPAMNTAMFEHPLSQKNLKTLESLPNYYIHPTTTGLLACGDEGQGKLASPAQALELIETWHEHPASSRKILITTGATQAPLDPVRYLTNPASGKTGYFLAKEFLAKGEQVHVISGHLAAPLFQHLESHPLFKLSIIKTTNEMKSLVLQEFPSSDTYISAAAICDLEFEMSKSKIKKDKFEGSLPFKNASDILALVLKEKSKKQKVIGFAAETNINEKLLNQKWQNKPVDLLIGNPIDNGIKSKVEQGFGTDDGEYWFFHSGELQKKTSLTKKSLAEEIYQWSVQ